MTTTSTPSGVIDLYAAKTAAADLLRAQGMDPRDPNLAATPRRVAKAYADLLTPSPPRYGHGIAVKTAAVALMPLPTMGRIDPGRTLCGGSTNAITLC